MKKTIYTLPDIAKAWEITRQRANQLFDSGRIPGGIPGTGNQHYWEEIPEKPKELKRGRPRIKN